MAAAKPRRKRAPRVSSERHEPPAVTAVTRFAPSPTGFLHLGHVAAATAAHARARAAPDGRFLLRHEDIDQARCRDAYRIAAEEDLAWLGLVPDAAARRQSEHFPAYADALAWLAAAGLTYSCFCSRAEAAREWARAAAAPHGPDGVLPYPGTCRGLDRVQRSERLARGDPHVIRLDMAEALRRVPPLSWFEEGEGRVRCDPAPFGDVVLGRRDVPASYHLCVTHDDALQGITVVTRGRDLRPATALHRLLQALFGWPEPAYAHHALVRDASGQRLSKRDGAASVRVLREAGLSPEIVRARALGNV